MADHSHPSEHLNSDTRFDALDAAIAAAFRPRRSEKDEVCGDWSAPNHSRSDTCAALLAETVERYEIMRELGRGGIGVVFLAHDLKLGRQVAIKVLAEDHRDNPVLVQRFLEEAQIGSQLQHPGIVPVHEVGRLGDGRPYFTMKVVNGRTMAALLDGEESIPGSSALLKIFEQVCQTVAYAHSRGVIHRDLKPENIMVGAFGEIQVTDWGLAKVLTGSVNDLKEGTGPDPADNSIHTLRTNAPSTKSTHGSVFGTPGYMSPEQASGSIDRIDKRTDVFALGAILCRIITGKQPYARGLERVIPSPDSQGDQVEACGADEELIRLAERCLATEAESRPRDAGEVAQAMADYLHAVQARVRAAEIEAVKAHTMAQQERRTRRLTFALAAAVLAILVLGGGGWFWFEKGTQARRHLALQALQNAKVRREQLHVGVSTELAQWMEARSASERAIALLETAGVDGGIKQEALELLAESQAGEQAARDAVQQVQKDRAMVERLAEIRLQKTEVKDGEFDIESTDLPYARAFREYGIDVEALPQAEAAARIRKSAISGELAAALDDWAIAKTGMLMSSFDWQRLLAVAQEADPDPTRNKVRSAVMHTDNDALRELALSPEAGELEPATIELLARSVIAQSNWKTVVELLRNAQRRHPDDFWINHFLALSIERWKPQLADDKIRFHTAAVALRPSSPGAHNNLGIALRDKGTLEDAVGEYRVAIRLQPNFAEAHNNLGDALSALQKRDEALKEYREALRLKPKYPTAHYNLGNLLANSGDLPGAIDAYQDALRLRPGFVLALVNLGIARARQGDKDQAIADFRDAVRLDPSKANVHCNLGCALADRGDLEEAADALREAVRLAPDYAVAHYNLGLVFYRLTRFAEAHAAFRRSHELGSKNPNWHFPSEKLVRECNDLAEMDKKLPDVLAGKTLPASEEERVQLALFCLQHKHLYGAAARLFKQAFDAKPSLAEEFQKGMRYHAACACVLAANGKGGDASQLDERTRAHLRQQALDWLRADLGQWREHGQRGGDAARAEAGKALEIWKREPGLSGVRDNARLVALSKEERENWAEIWREVDTILEGNRGREKK